MRPNHKLPACLLLVFLVSVTSFADLSASPAVQSYDELVHAIREARTASKRRVERAVEQEKVREAWEIGKLIDEHVLHHKERADYGSYVIKRLARDLGSSQTELSYMLQFARAYPIHPPLGDQLSWSHYRALLALNDPKEREALADEAVRQGWNRNQIREAIRRRRFHTQAPVKLLEITPGPLNTYEIIRLKDRLKIDLGFGLYLELPEKDSRKFKEGDIMALEKGKLKKAGPAQLFTYRAVVTQVVDGDTFHALIDLGFGVTLAQRVRLRRINAPEILTADGKEARTYLEKILFRDRGQILIQSTELDQHGRPIADVWVQGKSIDQELLDEGLAVRVSG